MGKKDKINKNTIPEGFTIAMATVDLIPVIFFGLACFLMATIISSPWLVVGAIVCIVSGFLKAIWKYIVVLKKKNVWPLFLQMRIGMPVGMLMILAGLIFSKTPEKGLYLLTLVQMPSLIFTIIGFLGMGMMIFFAAKLASDDAKSNWIEQITNSAAQVSFFIAVLIATLAFLTPLNNEQQSNADNNLVVVTTEAATDGNSGIDEGSSQAVTPETTTQEATAQETTVQETTEVVEEYYGFTVSGTQLLDANGNPFVMRGVNVAHSWYAVQDSVSLKAIAELGANCVRVVCANGEQWNKDSAKSLTALINYCRNLNMIAILEVHDGTGNNTLDMLSSIVDYWVEMKDVFPGTEAYCILNIANEWYGGWSSSTWEKGYVDAVTRIREAGIKNTIMIDAGGYGQNGKCINDSGKTVFEADVLGNTMFSIHMYGTAGKNDSTITKNLGYALNQDLCICVGEFGYTHSDGDVDEEFLMEYCEENGIGYLAWSWKGNGGGVEYLDLADTWDGSKLSSDWGEVVINGKNGIKETSRICTIFEE